MSGGPIAFRDRIVWVTPEQGDLHLDDPLPIVVWEENGSYARRMLPALTAIGRDYRIAVTARSMTAIRGAVTTGLAVTAMATSSITDGMRQLGPADGFPHLADLDVRLEHAHLRRSAVIDRLKEHLLASLADVP